MPRDASTWRQGWTQQDELAATAIEVSDAWGRQIVAALVAVHGGKVKLPPPIRIEHPERPGSEPEEKKEPEKPGGVSDIARFFSEKVK